MNTKPLYKTVVDFIKKGINSGQWVPGDLLPSEKQLSTTLKASVGTIRKAIDELENEKLVYRHHGKGTYVSKIDFNRSLFHFFTYGSGDESDTETRIHKVTPKRKLIKGPAEICQHLHVPENTPLIYIERVGYDDDNEPVLIEKCWWLAEIVTGLENEKIHIPDLFYALIAERFNVHVTKAEETLTAQAANQEIAKTLQIEPGSPLVVLLRTTYTNNKKIIEYRITRGRPDRFSSKTESR